MRISTGLGSSPETNSLECGGLAPLWPAATVSQLDGTKAFMTGQ